MADEKNTQTSQQEENSQQPQGKGDKDKPKLLPQNPADKYPTLAPIVKKLEKDRDEILRKSEPLRKQREDLLKQIQPLEARLRKVDEKIKEIERPHLPQINNELGALAKAMGGRSMSQAAE